MKKILLKHLSAALLLLMLCGSLASCSNRSYQEGYEAGFSTAQDNIRALGFGAGMGLPNMKRYSDDLRIETEIGKGTTVYMTILSDSPKNAL